MIYFIQEEATCHIKIGHTDGDPLDRLRALRTGSPSPLVLLGVLPGGFAEEQSLHRRFATARVQGEWFRPVPELILLLAGKDEGPRAPSRLRTDPERLLYRYLVQLLDRHGPKAFSLRGPLGKEGCEEVEVMARICWIWDGAKSIEGLRRVADAIEELLWERYTALEAQGAMHALDHRFDGTGDWYA
jgi:hypothetical protein